MENLQLLFYKTCKFSCRHTLLKDASTINKSASGAALLQNFWEKPELRQNSGLNIANAIKVDTQNIYITHNYVTQIF
jgi:hypothetical protein